MIQHYFGRTQLVLLANLLSATAALAMPCNTGVTGGASTCGTTLLAARSVDNHWTQQYIGGPPIFDPAAGYGPAYANRNNNFWLANGPASGWITPGQAEFQAELGGFYVYRTTFDGLESFKGRYSTDNELMAVFLNSIQLMGFPLDGPADFDKWTNFGYLGVGTLNATGNNLDFVVRNRGQGGIDMNRTVTGFRAEFQIPEPATIGLCLVALGGVMFSRRRTTQQGRNPQVPRIA